MRLRFSLLAAGVLLLGACYDKNDPSAPTPAFSITPTPTTIDVRVDSAFATPLSAVVKTAAGQTVADAPVSYVSEDPTVAGIFYQSSTGNYYVYGRQAGTTRILVNYGATSAPAYITVTVRPRPVVKVDLLPATATINTGSTVQLTATLLAGTADTVKTLRIGTSNVFTRAATFSVASADAAVASVNSTGRVTGLSAGTARVIATYKNTTKAANPTAADTATVADTSVITVNQSPVATITVTPTTATVAPKGNVTLKYTYRGSNGTVTTGAAPTVVSSNPAVATVGTIDPVAQTVIITAVAVGDATITFTVGTVTQTVLIAVR